MSPLVSPALVLLTALVPAPPRGDDLTLQLFQLYREFTDQEVAARARIESALEFERWREEQAARAWSAAQPYLAKPLETVGHYYLAGVLILAKRWKEAAPHLDAYLEDPKAPEIPRTLAIRLQTRVLIGAWDGALADLDQLLERYPEHLNFPLFQFALPALQREPARARAAPLFDRLERHYAGEATYEKVVRDFRRQFDALGTARPFPKLDDPPEGWPRGFDDGQRLTLIAFFRTADQNHHRILPFLAELDRRTRDRGVRVLGLTVVEGHAFWSRFRAPGDPQDPRTARAGIEAMRRGLQLDFPIGLDPRGELERTWDVEWQPHVVVLDTQGVQRAFWSGAAHFEWLLPRLEELSSGT